MIPLALIKSFVTFGCGACVAGATLFGLADWATGPRLAPDVNFSHAEPADAEATLQTASY